MNDMLKRLLGIPYNNLPLDNDNNDKKYALCGKFEEDEEGTEIILLENIDYRVNSKIEIAPPNNGENYIEFICHKTGKSFKIYTRWM